MAKSNESPINCVGIVCIRGDNVLLIKRGKPPRMGQWSIPGGRIEKGESELQAAARELFEETSIRANKFQKIETIDTDFGSGPYRLHDYAALWETGEPIAGDDAAHAQFMPLSQIEDLEMWSETVRIIRRAQALLSEDQRFNTR